MTAPSRTAARPVIPRWWPYYAFAVSLVAVVSLILGVVGVYTNGRQDAVAAAENKARDEQNRALSEANQALLACFDDFASDLSGGLPPVREASAEAQDQLSQALATLQAGLVKVSVGTFKPSDLAAIIREFGEYQDANNELVKVRRDNPYPDPPSKFCATSP